MYRFLRTSQRQCHDGSCHIYARASSGSFQSCEGIGLTNIGYRFELRRLMAAAVTVLLALLWVGLRADTITGTAFFVSKDGYAITCAHLVKDATSVELLLGERSVKAAVITLDDRNDLALLKVEETNRPTVILGSTSEIETGARVWVLGYPLAGVLGDSVKVTSGTVSGISVQGTQRLIQIDAAVNPGNSGGPLFNDRGQVIGVVNAKIVRRDVSGVGFAVPVNYAAQLLGNEGVVVPKITSGAVIDGPTLTKKAGPAVVLVQAIVPLKEPILVKSLPVGECRSASFSKSGKSIICAGGAANKATIWDVARGKMLQSFPGTTREVLGPALVDKIGATLVDNPIVFAAKFSPDEQVAAVSSFPLILIYDTKTGERRRAIWAPALFGAVFAFSPDGQSLLYGTGILCGEVECLNLKTAEESRVGAKGCTTFSLSPCGKFLAVVYDEDSEAPHVKGTVEIVGVTKGDLLRRIVGSRSSIGHVCYSPDGRWIAGTENNARGLATDALEAVGGIVTIWDSNSGSTLKSIHCPGMEPGSLHYSRDGKMLAVELGKVGKDARKSEPCVALYDVGSGERIALIPGSMGWQTDNEVFSPDGLLAVLRNESVDIWQVK